MLQRTKEWHVAREGRFTASRISELLTNGTRPMTAEEMIAYKHEEPKGRRKTIDCIGKSLYTYAFEKAVEVVYGYDPEDDFVSFDMKRGITLEPVAFDLFKRKKAEDFIDVYEVVFEKYGKFGGASSDGECSNNYNLEIKCPKRAKFFRIQAGGIDELDKDWIDQVQMQMLSNGSEATYFFIYYEQHGFQYGHEIIIPRDEERIAFIKTRLDVAALARDEFVKDLFKKQQKWQTATV